MLTADRRNKILKILCRRRHETIRNLASEFGVSERTIRRDIDAISLIAPIYTKMGRHCGGVYIVDKYSMDRMYMSDNELKVLKKLFIFVTKDGAILSSEEKKVLKSIISIYSPPDLNSL